MTTPAARLAAEGRLWLRGVLSAGLPALSATFATAGGPGRRIGANHPLLAALAQSGLTAALSALRPHLRPVRVLAFDKGPGANWALPWHQDRVIAVRHRAETPGYAQWSQKGGIWHCEPPASLLERMVFIRVHLDACNAQTGAMEIALGSHRHGPIPAEEAAAVAARHETEVTEAAPGDVLVLSMLTLHRSLRATMPTPRRVLRVDYADTSLPAPLDWAV